MNFDYAVRSMSTREKKRRKANDGSPVALPVSSRAAVSPVGDEDDKKHLYTPTIAVIHECMPGVLLNILSFLQAPELAAVSVTSKEMCRFIRVNDNLWQRYVPTFPCHKPSPLVDIPEEWVDPRRIESFGKRKAFFRAKLLTEYRKKAVTAFRIRRMRMLQENTDWMTTFLRPMYTDIYPGDLLLLSATQFRKLMTGLSNENLAKVIVDVSIQAFDNEGMSADCLAGIVNDRDFQKMSGGFFDAVYIAVYTDTISWNEM